MKLCYLDIQKAQVNTIGFEDNPVVLFNQGLTNKTVVFFKRQRYLLPAIQHETRNSYYAACLKQFVYDCQEGVEKALNGNLEDCRIRNSGQIDSGNSVNSVRDKTTHES